MYAEVQRFGLSGARKSGVQPAVVTVAVGTRGLDVWLGGPGRGQAMIEDDVEERHAPATAENDGGEDGGLDSAEPSPGHGQNIHAWNAA